MKNLKKLCIVFLLFAILGTIIFPCISNGANAVAQAYENLPESQLGLTNILSIILISVGVVLILLGIAILVRLKKM